MEHHATHRTTAHSTTPHSTAQHSTATQDRTGTVGTAAQHRHAAQSRGRGISLELLITRTCPCLVSLSKIMINHAEHRDVFSQVRQLDVGTPTWDPAIQVGLYRVVRNGRGASMARWEKKTRCGNHFFQSKTHLAETFFSCLLEEVTTRVPQVRTLYPLRLALCILCHALPSVVVASS